MKIHLMNTSAGLIPASDEDFIVKSKMKIGKIYRAEIKQARNYLFHQKYFALISCAWEYLNESQTDFFKHDKNLFRKTVEVAASHCEKVYSIERKEWVDVPKSINFSEVDEFAFREIYDNVKRVIFSVFLRHVSEDDFNRELVNF